MSKDHYRQTDQDNASKNCYGIKTRPVPGAPSAAWLSGSRASSPAALRDQARGAKARETKVDKKSKMAKNDVDSDEGNTMQSMSAKDAKYGFGRLIDLARSEPVVVNKHGRPVVVVLAVEEFERLRVSANGAASQSKEPGAKRTAKRRSTERA